MEHLFITLLAILSGMAFFIGVIFLIISARRNLEKTSFLLGISSLSIFVYSIASLHLYAADSVAQFLVSDRVQMFCIGITLAVLYWFYHLYTGFGNRRFTAIASGLFLLIPVLRLPFASTLTYTNIQGIRHVTLAWGETVSTISATPTRFAYLYYTIVLGSVAYLAVQAVRNARRNPGPASWALVAGSGMILLGGINDILVDIFKLQWVYLAEFGYIGLISFISIALMDDLLTATRLKLALTKTEERYRRLIETTDTGYVILDTAGRVLDANSEYLRLSGNQNLANILGRSVLEWTAEEEKEANAAAVASCMENGFIRNFEITYIHKNGDRAPVEINATVIETDGRQEILTLCRDISSRKKAEKSLRESEEQFKNLSLMAEEGIIIHDLSIIREANHAFARMIGYASPSDLLGKNGLEIIPFTPESRERIRESMKNNTIETYDVEIEKPDGSLGVFETSGRRITYRGTPARIVFMREVTERKRIEEAVASEKERLAVTLRSIGDAVIATDVRGNIVLMNKVAETLTGWSFQDAVGKPLPGIFSVINELTREPLLNPVQKVIATEAIVELANHTLLISRDGTERVIADSGAPIKDKNDRIIGVVLVFRDITEKQRFIDAMQRTAKLESLGVLAGGIAHDFNNFLTGIFGYIDLALTTAKEPQTVEYLESTVSSINRARALTLQLLTFAKGGSPVQKIMPLVPFIREAALFAMSGSSISCRFHLPDDLRPCNIDKNQIGQVIDNIVINAQQAMPNGGAVEIAAVNVSFSEKEHPPLERGDYVKVSIKDSGIGIPKDIMSRIFDPFYTTKIKGHGLGLATCHSIVSRHGGCIEVESEQGKGSTFHVYLPASTGPIPREAISNVKHKGGGTILIADDEAIVRDTLRKMLESMGYTVISKTDGKEVVDLFLGESGDKGRVTALIFDLTIPGGMGGIEAVAEIRKRDGKIPVFVVSGYAENSAIKNPGDYGFTASISKPFTIAELSEMLNRHLK
jgi:two-component system, cell cycle sensor histidine kinase and response regulator CckA